VKDQRPEHFWITLILTYFIWEEEIMKHLWLRFLIVVIAACLVVSVVNQDRTVRGQTSQATPEEWKATEQAIGKTGSLQPGSVFKIGLPRTDLLVKVHGVVINPMLALGSWIAFKKRETVPW
jgi:hypothetical protein